MDQQKAKAYHSGKKRIFYLGLAIDIILFLGLASTGMSVRFRETAFQASSLPFLANGIYTLLFCLAIYVFQFPLNFFSDFAWEHRFGLSRQKFSAWLNDELKKDILGLALVLVMVEVVYFLLGRFPGRWWVFAAVFWLFLSLFLARIMPNVIIPLFYKYVPVGNEALRQQIFELFKKCGVGLKDVYAINLSEKTKKANAFVCGLGKSRRVVLSDNLVSDFSSEEIETVVAHELGHYKHRDIVKLTIVNSIMIITAFFLMDFFLGSVLQQFGLVKSDIAGLPIFVLGMVVFGFVTTPLLNGYSRLLETQADEFSLKITDRPDQFITMMNKLGATNLAEFNPSRFDEIIFYDHPPIAKRLEMARNFKSF